MLISFGVIRINALLNTSFPGADMLRATTPHQRTAHPVAIDRRSCTVLTVEISRFKRTASYQLQDKCLLVMKNMMWAGRRSRGGGGESFVERIVYFIIDPGHL